MELTSIAFPAIGAGVAGIPFGKVAKYVCGKIGVLLMK
jgi:O-acetyl-ADP-ribose deacetylase (regulator of RNase III)